jgi:hypothetical protein
MSAFKHREIKYLSRKVKIKIKKRSRKNKILAVCMVRILSVNSNWAVVSRGNQNGNQKKRPETLLFTISYV